MSGNHFQKTPAMAEKAYECQVHLNTFEYNEKVQSFLQISSVKKLIVQTHILNRLITYSVT